MTHFAPRVLRAQTAAAAIVALSLFTGAVAMPSDAGIKLDNRSGVALDLWLDRDFVCHAPKDATCTVRVLPGRHELQARSNQTVVAREFVAVNAGENFRYRVERSDNANGQAPSQPTPMHSILFGKTHKNFTI